MFSSSAGRVARTSATSSTHHGTTSAVRSIAARTTSSGHQRRLSSSKASVPPNEDEQGKRVVSGQGNSSKSTTQQKSGASSRKGRAKAGSRNASGGAAVTAKERETVKKQAWVPLGKLYPEMPEPVRATNHLKREDIAAMQLFAGHLPISPNHVLPPPATDAQFDSIFTPKPHWQKYRETVDHLSGAIDGLESQQTGIVSESTSSEEPIIHLDTTTATQNADPLAQYYRLNRPPPPPRPIEDFGTERVVKRRSRKGKSWQTTITVTEWTDGQGHRTFRADSSPIVRVPQASQKVVEEPQRKPAVRQPFLERLRVRHVRWAEAAAVREPAHGGRRPRMLLISVKRQRKAKMKKHKLKKLRKRTRNLRRKLGKL